MIMRITAILIGVFALIATAQPVETATLTEMALDEAEAQEIEDRLTTKWLVFDFSSDFPYRDEEFTCPVERLPVRRRVSWIGAAVALSVNYDLMQCSNVWVIEHSELLFTYQQLYQARFDTDRYNAIQEAKLENISINVNAADGLNTIFNADYMITGSFDKPKPELVTLNVQVRRADPPFEIVAAFEFEGLYDKLPELARTVSLTIMDEFGLQQRPGTRDYWAQPLTDDLEAYRWMAGAITGGHSGKMISFFERALEADPDYLLALLEMGKVLYFEQEYQRAFDILKHAVETESGSNNQLAWLRNGNAYFSAASTISQNVQDLENPPSEDWQLGDPALIKHRADPDLALEYFETALDHYRRSVEIDPGYVDGWISIATTLRRLGRNEESLEAWREILTITDICDEAYFQIGRSLWNVDNDQALHHFERAIEINERHVGALYNAAALHQALGNSKRALEVVNIFFAWAPSGHSLYNRFDDLFQQIISN